ncbi:hypothetical protein MMC29_007926, partial [Sticta canariensis]|nr:hypothetical protein [Sticta canariensis]
EISTMEGNDGLSSNREAVMAEQERETVSSVQTPNRQSASVSQDAEKRNPKRLAEDLPLWEPDEDDEEALLQAAMAADEPSIKKVHKAMEGLPNNTTASSEKASSQVGAMNEGMMAALAKLRKV